MKTALYLAGVVRSGIVTTNSNIFLTKDAICDDKEKPLGDDIRWTPGQIDFLARSGIDTTGFPLGPDQERAAISDMDQSHRVWVQADGIINNQSLVIPYRFQDGKFAWHASKGFISYL